MALGTGLLLRYRGLAFWILVVGCGNTAHDKDSATTGTASSGGSNTLTGEAESSSSFESSAQAISGSGGTQNEASTGNATTSSSVGGESAASETTASAGGASESGGASAVDSDSAGGADEASQDGAIGSGGAASSTASATTRVICANGGRESELCLTREQMEAQARYSYGLEPLDPPRSDEEIAAAWDQNGCMDRRFIGEPACCNSAVTPGEPNGDQCCYIACTGEACCRPTTGATGGF